MEQLQQAHTTSARRDGSYEDRVNGLIDQATALANDEVGREDLVDAALWTEAFHRHLDLLAFDRGLRVASWIVVEGVRAWPRG